LFVFVFAKNANRSQQRDKKNTKIFFLLFTNYTFSSKREYQSVAHELLVFCLV